MIRHFSRQTAMRWIRTNNAIVALILICLYGAIASPFFLTQMNASAILYQYSIIGFLALGQLLVILSGGFDLSQGSLLAFTSILAAVVMTEYGPLIAIVVAVCATTALGTINGLLASNTKIPPFIITLGMLGIARGLALFIADSRPIPIYHEGFNRFGGSDWFGIPASAVLWGITAILLYYFLAYRRWGRYIYAIGSSEESARLSGIKINQVKTFVYSMSAFLTAIGGVLWTARLGAGTPIGGANYELESIAAVVVGGANLFGGQGTVGGTIAGVLIFGSINSILNLSGIDPFWQGTIKGILVLVAVALSLALRRRMKRK